MENKSIFPRDHQPELTQIPMSLPPYSPVCHSHRMPCICDRSENAEDARLLMRHTWSSNYCTLHVCVCVVPARRASSFTSQMGTEVEIGINFLGPKRPRPETSQAPGNSNTLVSVLTKGSKYRVPYLPLCQQMQKGVEGGEGKKQQ